MKIIKPFLPLSFFLLALSLPGCGGGGGGDSTPIPIPSSAGIVISKTTLSTSEDGTEDTFSVTLSKQPSSDVDITLTSRDTTEGLIGSISDTDWESNYFGTYVDLDFTPTNWNVPQVIKVQGQADSLLDGNQTYSIAVTWIWSWDLSYIGIAQPTALVTNVDTSAPGITVSTTNISTTEDSSNYGAFTVKLNVAPSSTVTLPLTISDASEGTFDNFTTNSLVTKTLTFTTSNWSYTQYVAVYGFNDGIADGNQTYNINVGPLTSSDTNYDGLSGDTISVTNIDDDIAAFTVSATALQTNEWGQNASFTVVLNSEPTIDVIIPVTSLDGTEGLVSSVTSTTPSTALDLTFTSTNWQIAQTVTVNAVDDADQDGDIGYNINVGAATGASEYTALPAQTIAVVNVDNDTARVNVQGADLQTTEDAGTDTFTVSLAKAPTDTVVINVTPSDTSEGRVKGGSSPTTAADTIALTFTTADWQTSQTVTVVGQDDFDIDSNQTYAINISIDTTNTLDAEYDVLSAQSISVTNADNDVAGLTVIGSIYSYESGTTDTFTVKLNTKPTTDVILPITVEDQSEFLIASGSSGYVSTLNLTFTTANWSTPQTITVQAVNDFVDENSEYFDVTIGSASSVDPDYDGLAAVIKSITIYDNDTAGFAITPSSGLVTAESGTSASFTIALTSEPVANIFVTIASGNVAEGLLTGGDSPATQVDVVTLQFSPADWQSAQTVSVHGQDDSVLDGPIDFNLTVATITGSDSNYNSLNDSTVGVTNNDNEPTNAEGVSTPVDITGLLPYGGLVDTTASYYMITGLGADSTYDFTATSVIDDISLDVYSNANFNSGLLCSSTNTGTKTDESCRATTTSDTVYIKIDGALTVNGASYVLNAMPVYSIETFSNGGSSTVDTTMSLYHSSNLTSTVLYNDDGGAGAYSKITTGLNSGETYYLKIKGFGTYSAGSYSIWITNTSTAPSSTGVPLDSDGEPGDDTAAGATLLSLDTVVDRTITAGDEDWYMFTVP